MRNLYVPTLVLSAALLVSCGPAVTNNNINTAPLNNNANTASVNANMNMANSNMAPVASTGSTISSAKTFTAAEVAMHNTEKDCYAIVSGDVYDLTKWVNMHPGGPEAIMGTCGKDISTMTHPGGVPMSQQVQKVAQFKIGSLAQ